MDGETLLFSDFLVADDRRATSFVSNFGDWSLPADVAEQLGSPVGHLEWFHDTGELVLIGDIPEAGTTSVELPVSDTNGEDVTVAVDEAADVLAGTFGAPGVVYRSATGAVRETVLGSVVSADTRVAVLAVIEHGPKVHEILWGWHRQHRHPDGWAWLQGRLERASS
jgi:hypothetical protein